MEHLGRSVGRNSDLTEDEAMRLAFDEVHAHRAEVRAHQRPTRGNLG